MALKIEGLTKSFGNNVLFDGFSFDFPECGIVAITGKSGVGKTTLLRMIAGLDNSYDGVIQGAGIKKCSFAFQEYRLFDHLSLLDNVLVAMEHPKNDDVIYASAVLFKLGFTESDLQLRPSELSGGMKQRANLARAIMKDSKILILDEPTKEIDEALVDRLYNILRELSRNRLIIFSSHNHRDIDELAELTVKL